MQFNMFADEIQLQRLSILGDPLEKLNVVDFELFRSLLEKVLRTEHKSNAGRPPFDSVMMFKILILQDSFNLSDDKTEFYITDRASFQRFLGLSRGERVPDAKTIWLFRNKLTKGRVIHQLFKKFNEELSAKGLITHKGTIVDATFVEAPRQRNSQEENKQIKSGEVPEEWESQPHKLAQKDTEARWAKKNGEKHYGYKDHVKVDMESKIIVDYATTPANVHDSKKFTEFLTAEDRVIYADSAYTGKPIPSHIENRVCEKGCNGKPLTEEQKKSNREKSRVRCRVEHVFAFMAKSMCGLSVRSIGIARADFKIGLTNLIYNLRRYAVLKQKGVCVG